MEVSIEFDDKLKGIFDEKDSEEILEAINKNEKLLNLTLSH